MLSSIKSYYKNDHIHSIASVTIPMCWWLLNLYLQHTYAFWDQILHLQFSSTRMSWRLSNSKCLKLNSVSSALYQNSLCSGKPALVNVTVYSRQKPRRHSSLPVTLHIPTITKKLILAITYLLPYLLFFSIALLSSKPPSFLTGTHLILVLFFSNFPHSSQSDLSRTQIQT